MSSDKDDCRYLELLKETFRKYPPLRITTLVLIPALLLVNHLDFLLLMGLASVGLTIGLLYGFRRDLNKTAITTALLLGLLFVTALISYFFGDQSILGFHILGRYLRFLLFIPVYVALSRLRVSPRDLRIAWTIGVLVLAIYSLLHLFSGSSLRVQGATGTPIVFGDLGYLTGIFAATLWISKRDRKSFDLIIAIGLILAGILTTSVSGTRTPLLALPITIFFAGKIGNHTSTLDSIGRKSFFWIAIFCGIIILIGASSAIAPRIQHVFEQGSFVYHFETSSDRSSLVSERCPNKRLILLAMLSSIGRPAWVHLSVQRIRSTKDLNALKENGCSGKYWIWVHNRSKTKAGWFWWHPELPPSEVLSPIASGMAILGCGRYQIKGTKLRKKFCYGNAKILSLRGDLPNPPTNIVSIRAADSIKFIPMQFNRGGVYYAAFGLGSLYTRIQMWRAAWGGFTQNPLLGLGPGGYKEYVHNQIVKGKAAPTIWPYDHPHNQYLYQLATQGLVGYLAFALALLLLFRSYLGNKIKSTYKMAVLNFYVTFAFLCITETLLIHSLVISWMVLIAATFIVCAEEPEEL